MLSELAIVATLGVTAAAETIHGLTMLHRHGDRTAKWFGATNLTALGGDQIYAAGDYYRQRYLGSSSTTKIKGMSTDAVLLSQLSASVPNENVLSKTAYSFFQGFYPPLVTLNSAVSTQKLNNGTSTTDPLSGYQFVLINGVSTVDPTTIWVKGDVACPAATTSLNSYKNDPSYKSTLAAAQPFYDTLKPFLEPIMGVGNVTYQYGYDIYDILNVASIHNASVAGNFSTATLDTARFLANTHEWNVNYNASQPARMIGGGALLGGMLKNLNATVTSAGKTKFNFAAGSYNNMIALFGLLNLTSASSDFYGLPNYAAASVFELFTTGTNDTFPTNPASDLRVRFLFRNGTDAQLTAFPMFGGSAMDYSWGDFQTKVNAVGAINSVASWCGQCGATIDFCVAANATKASTTSSSSASATSANAAQSGRGLSNAAAGGIGAAVTLAVVGALGGLAFLLGRKKRRGAAAANQGYEAGSRMEKHPSVSESSKSSTV